MAAQLSAEQIQKAEQLVQAKMASDPAFSNLMREGKIKFVVEPGEKMSSIKIVNMNNPDMVKKYGGRQMFNTPQEAEHFTAGFGRQPTREGNLVDVAERAVMPRYQHQIHDPIRKYTKSKAADAAQDVLNTARYTAPIAALLKGARPLPVAAITTGLGAVAKGVGALTGEEELQETWPNVFANAAAAGAAAAGNRYFSEDAVRDRQLREHVQKQLPGESVDALLPEIKEQLKSNNYTFDDWRHQPLRQFDETFGAAETPVRMKRLPMVFEPGKEPGTTSAKVMSRKKAPKLSQQQWDAVARKFMMDTGLTEANPNDVIAFIKDAWLRPQSQEGARFYAKSGAPDFTKKQLVNAKATETNEFTKELYKTQPYFDDPNLQKAYENAMNEYKRRWQVMKNKKSAAIVTPQQFAEMGDYKLRTPFDLGNQRFKISGRPIVRAGATLLPLAAQAVAPYVIKAIGEEE